MSAERRIDPDVAAALPQTPTELELHEIPAYRAAQSFPEVPESEAVEQFDRVVPADPEVTVRVYRPHGATGLPGIFWIHGGGMIRGSYAGSDKQLQEWVERYDCVCISVRYRFAPEHPYPAALDDCYAALAWVHENAAELGVDPERVGIAGYSAGAGLAAALALLARDRGELPVAFQLLKSPMLDDRLTAPSSNWQVRPWSPAMNALAWRAYLGDLEGDRVPVYAAPARATDLAGLPPAFVLTGSADIYFDESVAYGQALVHADVPTELHVYQDAAHGFELFAPESVPGRRANREQEEWLARVLAAGS